MLPLLSIVFLVSLQTNKENKKYRIVMPKRIVAVQEPIAIGCDATDAS
jgi:hypothetical protein